MFLTSHEFITLISGCQMRGKQCAYYAVLEFDIAAVTAH